MTVLIVIVLVILLFVAYVTAKGTRKLRLEAQARFDALSPAEQEAHLAEVAARKKAAAEKTAERNRDSRDTFAHGVINPAMVCPHCNTRGRVRTKEVTNKRGVSGGKATAAILTGGVSLLATGLSRKEQGTEAYCGACTNTWSF